MASGTITFNASSATSSGTYIQAKLVWREENQTTSGVPPLTSDVVYTLYLKKANNSTTLTEPTTGTWAWSATVAGTTVTGSTYLSVLTDWVTVFQGKRVDGIVHNASTGAKSISISGSVSAPSGTSLAGKTTSGSQTVALDTLYVAPTYTASTISAYSSSVRMGGSVSFGISRSSSNLTHKVTYQVGSYTGIIASSATTSCSWTVPDLLTATEGISTNATIVCETYNGGEYIGSSYCTVTVMPYAASTVSVSKNTVDVGGSIVIGVTSNSPNYSHDIKYKLNSGSEVSLTTISGGGSYTWTVPTSLAESMTGNNDRVYIISYTKYGSTSIGNNSTYFGVTISQATTPTLSPASITMGETMTIKLPRAASSFTHQVTYSFGEDSGLIHSSAGTSCLWTVPLDLAKQIRSNTSGTGYIRVVTFNGGTQVGSAQQAQFTATVPDNEYTKPTFTVSTALVNPVSLPASLSSFWIQNVSKLRVTFDASSEYSTIPLLDSAYTLVVGGSTTHGNPSTSNELDITGYLSATATVTDARGYSSDVNILRQDKVWAYSPPRVIPYTGYSDIVCERCTDQGTPASDGVYLHIKASMQHSPIVFAQPRATDNNTAYFDYRYKEASASWQGDEVGWTQLADTDKTYPISGTDSADVILSGVVSDKSKEYTIQIRAKDLVGNKHIITVTIPSEVTPLHLAEGGTGIGIGRLCSGTGVDIGWQTTFHTGIARNTIFYTSSLSAGWVEGHYLSEDFQDIDDSKVDQYSLFLAVVTGTADSTTKRYSVLCARQGDEIYGSLDIVTSTGIQSISIGMTYDENDGLYLDSAQSLMHTESGSHGALTELSVSNQLFITALYALI